MLLVVFYIGDERYALDSSHVLEIVPMVVFREVPGAPGYLCGLFQYGGQIVPVVDLTSLAGRGRSRRFLSSRIILVRSQGTGGRSRILGLLAERVTDAVKVEQGDLTPAVITIKDAPYIGDVVTDADGMILCIGVNGLLPPSIEEMLFPPSGVE